MLNQELSSTAKNLYSSVTSKLGQKNLSKVVLMSLCTVMTVLKYANLEEFTPYPNWTT